LQHLGWAGTHIGFQPFPVPTSRDNRHLALNGKTLRAIPVNARRGACASFGATLRRPSGLRPSLFVIWNTPVEVQFTSGGCLNYPCRTPVFGNG
jgi:hypothetical protein